MSCYHPILAYNICSIPGKYELVFSQAKALEYGPPRTLNLPCGKCIGCRLDYSRQWADRCMLELQYHRSSYFLTLTYDDVHLPRTYLADDNGEVIAPVAPLVKRDLQLFFKRLRKNSGQKIRYLACGEYGTSTFRPHYHAIVFGLELNDLEFYKSSDLGYNYFNSELLTKCWSDASGLPFGYIIAGDVTWDTCAYVARYVTKKAMGPKPVFSCAATQLQLEFSLMSRRPGIGRQYYDDHPELWNFQAIHVSTPTGGRAIYPPRYYEKLLHLDNPNLALDRSLKKSLYAKRLPAQKKRLTDKQYCDILKTSEELHLKRSKSLLRNLI